MKGVIKISKYSNTIEYNLRTKVDTSGVIQLQKQFASLNTEVAKLSSQKLLDNKQVNEALSAINKVQNALTSSFNSSLGIFDLSKFQQSLDGLSLGNLQKTLSAIPNGTKAFNNMLGTIGQIDTQFKSISSLTDKIFNTFGNTVRWGITASIFQTMQNNLYRAVEYVQELDTSLNNIRIVSGQSAEQMREFSLYANQAAQNLGQTTTAFTDAALIFIQQGLDQDTSNYLADLTLRMANVTQQDTATASEQITSIMNGYNMTLEETTDAIDVLANVAAQGASDMEELATAESRVAATASTLGVSQEQLAAQISTIISVTRQAPETVGNALRSIYSRMADLQLGDTLEDGVDLGRFSSVVESVGVQVLDASGSLRNMGDIIEDLMVKWQDLSSAQQISVGTTLAGRYQLNPFLTLMSNMDMYNEQLNIAENSAGTLEEQQSIYMDSMAAKLNELTAASEGFISTLFNPDDWKPIIELATDFVNLLTDMANSIGGFAPLLTGIASSLTKIFSNNLAAGYTNILQNRARNRISRNNEDDMLELLNNGANKNVMNNKTDNQALNFLKETANIRGNLTPDQQQQFNDILTQTVQLENNYQDSIVKSTQATENYNKVIEETKGLANFSKSRDIIDTIASEKSVKKLETRAKRVMDLRTQLGASAVENLDKKMSDRRGFTKDSISAIIEDYESAIQSSKLGVPQEVRKTIAEFNKVDPSNMNQVAAAAIKVRDSLNLLPESYRKVRQAAIDALAAQQDTVNLSNVRQRLGEAVRETFIDPMTIQQRNQAILSLIGSVGQLSFAWQSFQSLGSLWNSEDLDLGEKISQTIQNMLFTLPMLVSGLSEISQKFQSISKTSQAFHKSFEALMGEKGANPLNALIQSFGATSVAIQGAETRLGKFKAALLGISTSVVGLIAITAIIGGISMAIGAAQQEFEDMKETQKEALDANKTNLDSINESVDSFDQLYETYKETGQASDDLKESAQNLADALDIQGANALIASGNFDALAQSIRNAQEEAAKDTLDSAIEAQEGYINRSIEGGWFQNGVLYDGSLRRDFLDSVISANGYLSGTEEYQDILDFAEENADDALSQVRAAYDLQEFLRDEIEDLEEEQSQAISQGLPTTEIDNNLEDARNRLAAIGDFLSDETVTELLSSIDTGAAAEMQLNQDQFDGLMGQDLIDAYLADPDSQVAMYEAVHGWADTVRFLIQNTDDELQRISMEAELATYNYEQAGLDAGKTQEDVDELVSQLESNFSDEEIVQLEATLDYDELVKNIDEIIQRLNAGEDFSDILLDITAAPETSDFYEGKNDRGYDVYSNKRDEADISSVISDLELTEEAYRDYENAISSSGELSGSGEGVQQIEELNKELRDSIGSLEDQQDAVEKNSQEWQNYQDQIDKANEQIDENNAVLDDARSRAIESAKGIEELCEVFADNAEIIRNTESNTLQYTDAVNNLLPGLEHLLNIDMSDWDQAIANEFIAQNLNDIEAAINGDVIALQNLRGEASKQILINAGIDPETEPELYNEMIGIIDYANQKLPDLQAGASIDDTVFLAQLQNMVNNALAAGVSVDKIMEGLNGLGVEAEVTYKPTKLYFPQVAKGADTLGEAFDMISSVAHTVNTPTITLSNVKKISSTNPSDYAGYRPTSSGGSGGSSGGKKGGGGGGSGSGKTYEPKTKDPVENELDRYERVDTELDAISNDLEKIADEQDRLLGDDLAKNMSKQIDLLKEQIHWQNEKLKIQKEEAAEYRNTLSSQYGVTFNDEGFITNYADRYKAYLNNLNSLIDKYNSTTTEAGQESLEKQIKNAEEAFDKFNELIDNYDELLSNSIKESEAQIEQFYDEIENLQIEAFNTAVAAVDNIKEIQETTIDFNGIFSGLDSDDPYRGMMGNLEKLKKYWDVGKESMEGYYDSLIAKNNEALQRTDLSEAQRNWLEYQNQVLQEGKAAYGQGTIEPGGTGYLDMELNNLNTIIGQITQFEQQGFASIFGENEAELYATAKDIFDSATQMMEDYEAELDDMRDNIIEAIDLIGEALDDRIEQYQNINDELEHYGSMIEMLHGENAYDELNQALSAQVSNNQSQIGIIKESIAILQDMQSVMQEGTEEWENVQEKINEKQSELLDKTEETMEQIVQIYENGVNNVLDQWTANSPLGSDLDWISDEWELINRNADYYLDDVNAAYNIQKLQGKYLELLDGTDDLLIQQQITAQMNQQLDDLREKNKLSQYDVDYANAQLEILQRTIALQEAQRNKSQLQLRRDTQGNYNYVYTANEGDIATAQSDLLDAQNNAYNLSKDQIKQTQDDSLSALQDAKNMLNNLWMDANLTLEEKTARTQTIIDSLKEYLAGTGEQLSTAETNIINDFIGMCELLTDENRANMDNVYNEIVQGNKDAFDQIDTRWSTSLTQWLLNLEEFNGQTDKTFNDLVTNYESYESSLKDLSESAGIHFDDMTSHISAAKDATQALDSSTKGFLTTITDNAGKIKEYENYLAEMTAKIKDADNAMKAYQEQVNDLSGKLTAKEQENANLSNRVQELEQTVQNYQQYGNANGASGNSNGSSGGVKTDYNTAFGIAQAIWTYGGSSGWGNDPIRSSKLTKAFGKDFAKQVQSIINQYYYGGKANQLVNHDSMKYSSYNLIGYDTGGYTGDFNDPSGAGRLAILHSKELVLNESDTKNILQAVEAVRNLTTNFRSGAFENAVEVLSNYGSQMLAANAEPQDFEQNVHIEATFPNVVGAEEVERALLNLTNSAMQYANRNGRNPVNSNGSFS